MPIPWLIYICITAAASLAAFALYGWDKHQARRGRWRVSEATLQTLALLGGWPGALLGRRVFGHKTRKLGFTLTLWTIALVHLLAVAFVWRQT